MQKLQDELMQREKEFWGATNDPQFFRDNMSEDALAVVGGGVRTRDEAVKSTGETAAKWTNVQFHNQHFVQMAADAAGVVYDGSAEMAGRKYSATITSVYARRGGKWVLVLTTHAETPGTSAQTQKEPAAATRR